MPIFHHDVAQYSEVYDRLRLGIPTSSHFHKIITPQGKPSKQWREYACVLIEFIPIGRLGFDDQAPLHRGRIIKFDFPLQYPLGDQHAGVFTPLFRRPALGCNDLVEVRACGDPKLEAVMLFRVLRHVMMKDGHDWPLP